MSGISSALGSLSSDANVGVSNTNPSIDSNPNPFSKDDLNHFFNTIANQNNQPETQFKEGNVGGAVKGAIKSAIITALL